MFAGFLKHEYSQGVVQIVSDMLGAGPAAISKLRKSSEAAKYVRIANRNPLVTDLQGGSTDVFLRICLPGDTHVSGQVVNDIFQKKL